MWVAAYESFWLTPSVEWTNQGHNNAGALAPVIPVATTVADNFNRANEGPEPTGWALPNDGSAGDGLVVLSNQLARKATGGFRQHAYWNTQQRGGGFREVSVLLGATGSATNDSFTLAIYGGDPTQTADVNNGRGLSFDFFWQSGSTWNTQGQPFGSTFGSWNVNGISISATDRVGLTQTANQIIVWKRTSGGVVTEFIRRDLTSLPDDGAGAPFGTSFDPAYSLTNWYGGVQMMNSQNIRLDDFVVGRGSSTTFIWQDVRVQGQATSNQANDVRITGITTSSNDSRDIRVTGQAVSSQANDVRVQGTATSSVAFDTRITGQATSNQANDVRITGQATSNQTNDVRIQGQVTSSIATDVRATGTATSNVAYDTRITGQAVSSFAQDVKLTALTPTQSSLATDVRITGQATSSTTSDIRVTGQTTSNDTRNIRATGQAISSQANDVRITGQAQSYFGGSYYDLVSGDSALIGYWRLGESSGSSMIDSKNARVGTYSGSYTLGVTGGVQNDPNTAVGFDGSTSYGSVGADGTFNPSTFSTEALIYPTSAPSTGYTIASAFFLGPNAGWWTKIGNDLTFRLITISGGTFATLTSNATIPINRWTHVVATYDGTTSRLYINGELDNSGAKVYATSASSSFAIGAQNTAQGEVFLGNIDEVSLYNGVLSATAIRDRFRALTHGQDIRLTGQATSSDNRDSRITGITNISNVAYDARVTGQATSSATQDTRITGQASSNQTNDIRITGMAISSQANDVRATGQATSSVAYDSRIVGQTTSSVVSDVRVIGQATSNTSFNTRVTGQLTSSQTNDVRVTGQATSSTSQDVKLTAFTPTVTSLATDARITGQLTSSLSTDTRITGQATSSLAQDIRVTGQATSNTVQDARVTGQATSSQANDIRVIGQATLSTSYDVRVNGPLIVASAQDVRITGQLTTSTTADVRITGTNTSNVAYDSRVSGHVVSNQTQDMRTIGTATSSSETDARIFGLISSSDIHEVRIVAQDVSSIASDVRITGQLPSTVAQDVRTFGNIIVNTAQDVEVIGGIIVTTEKEVRTTGTAQSVRLTDVRVTSESIPIAASYEARVTGILPNNDIDVRVTGQASTNTSYNVRITSQVTTSTSYNTRVTGQVTTSQAQDSRVVGEATNSTTRDVRIVGYDYSYAYQWQRADDFAFTVNVVDIAGQTASTHTVDALDLGKYLRLRVIATNTTSGISSAPSYSNVLGPITGGTVIALSQEARVTGQLTSNQVRDVRVIGQVISSTSSDVRIVGQATAITVQDVRITGQASANRSQDIRVTGQLSSSSAVDVRVSGPVLVSSSTDVRLIGQAQSNIAQDVRVAGRLIASVVQDTRITGKSTTALSSDVRIVGRVAPQILRPFSDVTTGTWHAIPASPPTLFDKIDEIVPDTNDYIESSQSPVGTDVCEVLLSPGVDPFLSVGPYVIRYGYRKNVGGGDQINLTVRLMQGTLQIASWTHVNIDVLTYAEQTLTAPQVSSITDYTDLRLRFEAVVG